uniref:NADH-ubiquinone oxidoreductase chain 3 n=1 Tax=Pseudognaptodon sp. QL-2014 TaxID=1491725 RepID=A0A0U1WEI0_9HYME|nr:NADH dehydrogenase subunit 3 [Pseudognaptodon sp. QL-2014]
MLLWMLMIVIFISLILMILNILISKKEYLDREKLSSFECGFDSLSSSRLPFSIHFYMIGILFLIFDVEIIFLFPLVYLIDFLYYFEWLFLSLMIMIILFLGLEFEKKEGSLKWIF